jgi:hypothetical protein
MAEDDVDVEDTTPLKAALFESVRRQLVGKGFELKAAKDKFIRRRDGMTDHFQLVFKDAKRGYRIQPDIGMRIDIVEEIFHQTSGFEMRYQGNTSTMGAAVGTLVSGSPRACEFLLESESEIPYVTEKILRIFRDVALPYFEHWGSLAAIDAELNNKPAERTYHRALAWFRCSTGIIVAKLVGRSDYENLVAFYTSVMTQDNKGFYLKRFQALVKSLESVET